MTRLTEDLLLLARTDKFPSQHQDIINFLLLNFVNCKFM
jgi:hypothetical protein